MGTFVTLSSGQPKVRRNHKRIRAYRVYVLTSDIDTLAKGINARPLWSGEELEQCDDGYSLVELVYGPVYNNAPSDCAGVLEAIGCEYYDPPIAINNGRCVDECEHPGPHYADEVEHR